jgi:opacity protein-like surface antigen
MTRLESLTAAAMAISLAAPAAASAQQTPYVARPPAATASPPSGWALSASLQGRTVNFGDRTWAWADDPFLKPDEHVLGYGWRGEHNSVQLGYRQSSLDPAVANLYANEGWASRNRQTSSLLGFNWTYRPAR